MKADPRSQSVDRRDKGDREMPLRTEPSRPSSKHPKRISKKQAENEMLGCYYFG